MKKASKRLENTNEYVLKRWSHTQPARALDPNLKAAGIPKYNPLGKFDFHACRVAYINLLLTAGDLSPIEVQQLARHASLDLTMNVYGRGRQDDNLANAVEHLSDVLSPENGVRSAARAER